MMHELIIDGQPVDLGPDTDITLEFASSLFGDIGKLHVSRSYTVKLPKTARNARILDDPGVPGHDSTMDRTIFSARYYRNGIDLVGEGQAYVLSRTPDGYEIGLVWSVPGLSELASTKSKLPDLTGLSYFSNWKGASVATSATKSSIFLANYTSGAWSNAANIANHPSITMAGLLGPILRGAGVSYAIEDGLLNTLQTHALLIAPSHKPDFVMEWYSGSRSSTLAWVTTSGSGSYWWFTDWNHGWDAILSSSTDGSRTIRRGTTKTLRIVLNLKITGASPALYISLEHGGESYILRPTTTPDGGYLIDQEVDLEDDVGATEESDYFTIAIKGLADNGSYTFSRYDSASPIFTLIRPHEAIQTDHDNRFPIAANLPSIGQYDFVKAVFGLFGVAPVIKGGKLYLDRYDNILQRTDAVDWSEKVDMSEGDGLQEVSYELAGFAQANRIIYESDKTVPFDPTVTLRVDDITLEADKDRLKLPFAASQRSLAQHYKCSNAWDSDGQYYVAVEEVDIKPRIFGFRYDSDVRWLDFGTDLWGEGAVNAYHSYYQEIIRKPVVINVNIRLNEIDLAQLDFTRPVYLRQYGQYYAVLKAQTSETDLCKVELLQLP